MKYWGWILFIAIILVGFFIFSNRKKPVPLQFVSVKRENIREEVSGAGTLTGKNSVNLHFKTSGKLAYMNVDAGDIVSQWQIIGGLDTETLNIALRETENTLRDKRAIVDKIHDDLKDVGNAETFAQRQTRTTAEAAQDNAYEGLLAAKQALSDSVLYSPIPGIVIQALNVAGQNVSAADVIAQVVDNSQVFFDTDIDEADIGKITIGLSAVVALDAYPTAYAGEVAKILPQIKTTSSGANAVTVRIRLDSSPENFVNGLSGEATIIIKSAKNVLTIPIEALREDNTVFVQSQKGLTPVGVSPGISSDVSVEIVKGLQEKQRVLLNPPSAGNAINRNNRSGIRAR
ncbi:MAG: efflux RND transporter periplasmic adaptor subunit [Candidatus Levybacteria bacterium]|nr:efflux RND transporter periplasmic adaptor subunit [Candidatus Levybacteria bacterium]